MTEEKKKTAKGPVWRESASLIICTKNPKKTDGYDYDLLLIKRSDKTAIVQNQGVFPGGILDLSDESVEWLKYFQEFGISQEALKQLVVVDGKTERPKILAAQGTGCYDRFFKNHKIWAREISLRINAIRETFEEVGILVCRNKEQLYSPVTEGFCKELRDIKEWQKAVHDNPLNFLKMCRELRVVPDLWGLNEWTCWASPAVIRKGFETAFYITFLNEKPSILCEISEVKEHLWLPPTTILSMVRNGDLFFMPPQFYEISRFMPYKSYDFLKNFATELSRRGVVINHPILYTCTDGAVSVLPGDEFHVGCPRVATAHRTVDFTIDEFRSHSKRIHRMEDFGTPDAVIYMNIDPIDGHLKPLCAFGGKHKL
ncbi:acyl-coenzyme A diphosphatase NUDT19 [Musca domestica]|uniref:Acyl-coenzyme A diphosphatase NUDT19 n=1 Tax=Musca domestica TaxID=7370 RepID=A0ABM3V5V6_MUSDO|nr:acyl-coenzyme A diphosphatase NUDT19 [Musca domestica]XP_058981170.1 acyl-coenzyme A diphosphatase NUDT19 [Musca domestica]XP_058981171.1 acyl-coenzyme A diphosphatase NUDT19 [Musca domestica]